MFTQSAPMITSLFILTTLPSRRQDFHDVLRSIAGRPVFRPGRINSGILQNPGNPTTFLLYDEWIYSRILENYFTTSFYYRFLLASEWCIHKLDVVVIRGIRCLGWDRWKSSGKRTFSESEVKLGSANNE